MDEKIREMDKNVVILEEEYSSLSRYFGEDPKTVPSDEFFSKINRIWIDYKNV